VPLATRIEIVSQVAEALQAAHECGIIHRDVKPSNVLVEEIEGCVRAKLTDFGIGQVTTEEALAGLTKLGFTLTLAPSSSGAAGTQTYMAPEVLAGKPATTRSDIYAVGVLLYQMTVGEWDRPVTVDWTRDVADPLLREDLARCFAGNPEERFAGAGKLAKQLRSPDVRRMERQREEAEKMARERAGYRRVAVRAATLATLLVAVFGLLAAFAFQSAREAKRQRDRSEQSLIEIQLQKAENLFSDGRVPEALSYLARVLRQQPTNRVAAERLLSALCQRNFPLPASEPVHHDRDLSWAIFSTDWHQIATASVKTAQVFAVLTRRPITSPLGHNDFVRSLQFSPDGTRLVTCTQDGTARLWDAHTGQPLMEPLRHFDPGASNTLRVLDLLVRFSPDGNQLLIAAGPQARLFDSRTGRLISSAPTNHYSWGAELSPTEMWNDRSRTPLPDLIRHRDGTSRGYLDLNGDSSVTASDSATVRVWDERTGQPLTEPLQNQQSFGSPRFSPDGQQIITVTSEGNAQIWDVRHGQVLTWLLNVRSRVGFDLVRFSPDGLKLLTSDIGENIWLWDFSNGMPLTNKFQMSRKPTVFDSTLSSVPPQFSPDGRRIAGMAGSRLTVRVWDALSGATVSLPLVHSNRVTSVDFSKDGTLLLRRQATDTLGCGMHRVAGA
jgi:WD40 repeat protein